MLRVTASKLVQASQVGLSLKHAISVVRKFFGIINFVYTIIVLSPDNKSIFQF